MGDTDKNDDLPYRAEYAKSGRAKCKGCKGDIPKGDLRMASLTQSAFFDGKQANWFHQNCFFGRNRPKDVAEIGHFEQLRWEDQEKIKTKIADGGAAPLPSGKGKSKSKKGGDGGLVDGTIIKDFRTEYAKSGAAKCRTEGCEEKIGKGEVRIAKKDYEDDRAKMYGPMDRWHHAQCFIKNREKYEFFTGAENLAGLNTLSGDDKTMLKTELKKISPPKRKAENGTDEPDSKRIKTENIKEDPEKEEMKKQNKKMFYYRDLLEKNLKKKELSTLLEHNAQEIPEGPDRMLDRLGDIMTFGALKSCRECNGGQFVYQSGVGYRCMGDLSEWTKCQVKTLTPARKPFKIPEDFRCKWDFLSMYKYKERTRIIPNVAAVIKSNKASAFGHGSSTSSLLPLRNMSFVLSGKVDKKKLQKKIEALGGTLDNKVTSETLALISDKETVLDCRSKVSDAKKYDITVVDETFLAGVKTEGVISMVKQHTISEWGMEPDERISKALTKSLSVESGKSGTARFLSNAPKSVKLKLKGGAYVDPESDLEHKAHVLKTKEGLHTAVLGAVNIQDGKNSYYKLQLLEHDKKKKWYVFRSWGRIGTTIGGTKIEDFEDMYEALRDFEFVYEEKTGNKWRKRHDFKKVAGRFFPLDIDMGENNEKVAKINLEKSTSLLPKSVQKLVSMVFDIESMKRAMLEFEIDLTKMPLGKLSKNQIETAYKTLTEVLDMIKTESGSEGKFLDASNRFFTMIPHDFGMRQPPLLDNPDLVKSKIEMLDNLLEIELAFTLLTSGDDDNKDKDPIDAHYDKLNTEVKELPRDSEEWKMLESYVKNTHASTHTQYTLEIQEIFKVERKGEKKRFKPFRQLPNHQLLWHGSRTTNFAGILSQGLRIAPPEAPVTGYMFGKGVYFADMVSKSANYCSTNKTNNTALLMLCQVALGNMYERFGADYIEKLPAGFHSCKGVGKTEPDPAGLQEFDGVKVPSGVGVKDAGKKTDLLYNEYIVYDVGQIQAKYLFQMKFNYKM